MVDDMIIIQVGISEDELMILRNGIVIDRSGGVNDPNNILIINDVRFIVEFR